MMNEQIKWNGYEFFPPKGQEVFYSTEWFKGCLGKGKQHDPNNEFECLWRIVDTAHRITGNNLSSSKQEDKATTSGGQNVLISSENTKIQEDIYTGSQVAMGTPLDSMTPTPTENSGLLKLLSLEKVRSDNPRLTIAYDCEYFYSEAAAPVVDARGKKKVRRENGNRNITSYQFALYAADQVHILEVVFLVIPTTKNDGSAAYKRLMLSQALGTILDLCSFQKHHVFDYRDTRRWSICVSNADGTPQKELHYKSYSDAINAIGTVKQTYADCLIDTSNLRSENYKNIYSDYMGERAIDITILCHSGIADLSAFATERNNRSILKMTTAIQGGLVSTDEYFFRAPHKDYWKFYPCMVTFRDTMCFAAPGKKTLRALGEALDIPKVELPDGAISNMGDYLKADRNGYLEYSANDALITLVYASRMWGINKEMPLTASSAAAKGAYLSIRDYMGLTTKAEYQLAYGGLKKVVKGKTPLDNRPGYMEVSNLEPYDHRAFLLLNTAANSYKGGFNSCTRVGWYDNETYYDYDLQNAYPTSMCSVFDIDFRDGIDPLEYDPICNKELSLSDFNTPYDPLFAYIQFEFPVGTKFPCIPVSHEGSLVFPRTSNGFEGVYACGPDIYLALKMGAKVHCLDGYRGRIRCREDGTPSRSLREAVFQLVQDRNTAKKLYGKGSIEELILKIMVNSVYGKTAQNVIQKHSWDGLTQEYKDLGMSVITCPVHAAITTAGVRCVLIAAMTQLEELGYKVYSVTTDGFISNAPLDVLSSLDLFGFADVFKQARLYLTEGKSDEMWEPKHTMDRFLNLSTRANVSPDMGGVCAHGGLVTGFVSDSIEDRDDYIRKVIKRSGTVPSPHMEFANLKTLITKEDDFHTYDCITNISFDFDMKRKPIEKTLYPTWVNVTDGSYCSACIPKTGYDEMACFDTAAFDSIAEYEKYRCIKESSHVLRTADEWKRFFVKVQCPESSKIRITDADWTSLMSCIIHYRQGNIKIEALDNCASTKEKIDYINQHNSTGRKFTETHWKNARRPERASSALPIKAITDTIVVLQGVKAA